MVNQIEQEYGPEALGKEMAKSFDSEPDAKAAESFFEDFGRRWMERSIELGEQNQDRTYQVLKETAKEVPELQFPFISQRYIEIAYLSTQPIYTVPIVENGTPGLVFKMVFCDYFKTIQDAQGEDFANQLHCKSTCLAACDKAFEHFGHDVKIGMDTNMTDDGVCQFNIRRA
jgi:hypothetical protein